MKCKDIILLLLLPFSLYSCDDEGFLTSVSHGSMTDVTFWKNESDALGALQDIYVSTFDPSQPYKECRSDNAVQLYDWMDEGTRLIADGTVTPFTGVVETTWSNYYTSIRKCNWFLENVERTPFTTPGLKERMIAEVKTARAYTYLYAAFDFGDIPLVTKTLTIEESKEVLPSKQKEIFNFVTEQLTEAAGNLNDSYPGESGRINKGACLTIKARAYLFQNDYENLLSTIEELEALNKYDIYTNGDDPYTELFSTSGIENCEVIFPIHRAQQTGNIGAGHSTNAACLLKGIAEEDPYVTIFPAGSLVDSYPMLDGRLIHEKGSTYDPRNPYQNRDPRLKKSIICPGDKIGRLVGDAIVWDLTYDPEDPNSYESFRYDYVYTSTTGFVWKKYIDWTPWGFRNVWNCSNDIIVLRWADVLLMKAEALSELYGVSKLTEVCDIIDKLRDRCGGGKVHRENYASQQSLIDLVRNERRVELANEGLRYFDLIRWRIAEQDPVMTGSGLNGDLYGAYMRLDGIGQNDKTVLVDGVPRRFVEPRTFDKTKRYLLPVPQKELDFNPNLYSSWK